MSFFVKCPKQRPVQGVSKRCRCTEQSRFHRDCECMGITKKDIHILLKPARHREASAEADGQFDDFNSPEAD